MAVVRIDSTRPLSAVSSIAGRWRLRERSENFPVVLRFLPSRYRDQLHAVYAFARAVDELGDAGPDGPSERTARLRVFADDLERTWQGIAVADPVLTGLSRAGVAPRLALEPFLGLVQANLQDQVVSRYETFEDLLGYCRLSADPVGRIVLGIFGVSDPALAAYSDRICTALQLLEHWQDVGEDRRAGRVYLPQQDLRRHHVSEDDLDRSAATPALRRLICFETERAATLLDEGMPLLRRLHGWARPCVAGYVAGGQATVAALRGTGGEVLAQDVVPSRTQMAASLVRLLLSIGTTSEGPRC